jgi:hypothetical protein
MNILWDENNVAHIARHGITPELAEKVIEVGWSGTRPASTNNRYILEATIGGKKYRVICDVSKGGAIYPVTAYPLRGA